MILRIVIFTYSLLLSIAANSANYRFQHINSEQGLPHQQVETMVQDQKGNIWIGTRNGLAKYDGYDIFTYYHDENKTTSLRHNYIHTLYLDKKNRLWICTEIGVCLYRRRPMISKAIIHLKIYFGLSLKIAKEMSSSAEMSYANMMRKMMLSSNTLRSITEESNP